MMCSDQFHDVSAGYSFGINGNDDWGIEISESLGVPVFEFDCWNTARPKCGSKRCNLTFQEECLTQHEDAKRDRGSASKAFRAGKIARSLREHLLRTSLLKQSLNVTSPFKGGQLLLKMDVEGSEWGALSHAAQDDLQQMRQIIVEFHQLDLVQCHAYFAKVLQKVLDAGFAVAHIHGNNWGSMDVFDDGRYMIPNALEVTFVNKHALSDAVLQRTACSSEERLLPEDARNHYTMPDLPLAELPDDAELVGRPAKSSRMMKCRFLCGLRRVSVPVGLGAICVYLVLGAIGALILCKAVSSWRHVRAKHFSWFFS